MTSTASKYPYHYERSAPVAASAQTLFALIDDQRRLSSHMTKKSWMMAGSTMSVSTDEGGGRQVGSLITLEARMAGTPLRVQERVTQRNPPFTKTWETIGEPHLLVIGAYRMGFNVSPMEGAAACQLTVFIDYSLPAKRLQRFLGRLLGPIYAHWCTDQMVRDAQAAFAAAPPASSKT